MRWLVALIVLSAGCATIEPELESSAFEPVHFHLNGAGRVSYRMIIEGGPDTLCSWRQASEFRENSDHEAAGFRAVFRNDTLAFASWNTGTRGDRVHLGEYDVTMQDQIAAIAHSSSAVLNGTGRLEVWFSYGAPAWTHDSLLECKRPPEIVQWFEMRGILWDMNTLDGGPFVNRPVGNYLAGAQVTVARDYGIGLHIDGELIGTVFSRDAPGTVEVMGPSPKQIPLGPGVQAALWKGDAGDYRLEWDATHAGSTFLLTGSLLDATEADPSAIHGFSPT